MATKTTRDEMRNFAAQKTAESGSELVAYSYAPTEGFLQTVLAQRLLRDEASDISQNRVIDGLADGNDESYRKTTIKTITGQTADGETTRRTTLSLARQIETKADQEAVIRLVTRNTNFRSTGGREDKKAVSPLVNVIPPYTKFFLEGVTEDRMEKSQIVETFGDFIVFFFGRRPEVSNFSGRLLNTKNHDWKNDFVEVYENFLRGTKAVENNSTVFIQYDDVIAEGFLMNCHLEYHGITNNECPFTFSMLIIDRAPINQLQRLRERRARNAFSAAEQQLIGDLNKLRSTPKPFSIMQKALSLGGLSTSDIVLIKAADNQIKPSNPVDSPPTVADPGDLNSRIFSADSGS